MRKATAFVLSVLMLGCTINVFAGIDRESFVDEESYGDFAESGTEIEKNSDVSMEAIVSQNDMVLSDNALSINETVCTDDEELRNSMVVDETENWENNVGESISVNEEIINEADRNAIDEVSQNKIVSENIISENEMQVETEESEKEIVSENVVEVIPEEKSVSKVKIPTNTHVYLDPENLAGRGGIFSDSYEVINYGSTDVAVKIRNINISYGENAEVHGLSSDTVNEKSLTGKKINLNMVWSNKDDTQEKALHITDGEIDEYVIYLKASEYGKNGRLEETCDASRGEFYFTGTLSADERVEWTGDELSICFDYEIVNMESADSETDEVVENILAVEEGN